MPIYLKDLFTGTAGTNLSAHTPNTGGAWSAGGGTGATIQILASSAVGITSIGVGVFYSNATTIPAVDLDISWSLKYNSQVINSQHNFYLRTLGFGYYDGAGTGFWSLTGTGGTTVALTNGQTYSCLVQFRGTTVTFKVDGTTVDTATGIASVSDTLLMGGQASPSADSYNSVGAQWSALTVQSSSATAISVTGPTTGTVGVQSTDFTFTLDGTTGSNVTVTPSMTSLAGSWSPSTISIAPGASGTSKFTPSAAGTGTPTCTNSASLTNGTGASYVASSSGTAPTTCSVSGPTSGQPNVQTGNFTFTLNGSDGSTVAVTPVMSGLAGSWSPTSITVTAGGSGTSRFTPTASGSGTPAFNGFGTPDEMTVDGTHPYQYGHSVIAGVIAAETQRLISAQQNFMKLPGSLAFNPDVNQQYISFGN